MELLGKQIAIIGNILIAALLAFSVIIIGIFDIFPFLKIFN
jgi:4-hydroxybenzoate polyprenyltransferase